MNILVVEDNQDFSVLLDSLIKHVVKNVAISYAGDEYDAIAKIGDADLVISDFNFPIGGFLSILPTIQKENKPFILQSSCPSCVKIYDADLQIAALCKSQITDLVHILKKFNDD